MARSLEPKTEYRARWGEMEVYERFLLMKPSADAGDFLNESYAWVYEIQNRHFDQPYGYVVNRVRRNASSPAHYVKARKEAPLWRAFAVVSDSAAARKIFELEILTLRGMPCQFFASLEAAKQWMDEEILKIRSEG